MFARGLLGAALVSSLGLPALGQYSSPVIINHEDTDITQLTEAEINYVKSNLHIAYQHTSHGSQVTDGMTGLVGFANGGGKGMSHPTNIFQYNNGGTGGALDLRDYGIPGASDLGAPNRTQWATATQNFLADPNNGQINVVMWSWCGQVSSATASDINTYLTLMSNLEANFPDVHFVYMTGHTEYASNEQNTKDRNQQIRDYCVANNRILYDFADIESWNPDGNNFPYVDDSCDYYDLPYSDANHTKLGNWATEWQNSHTQNTDWYSCSCAHSVALNGNQKAYAAWHLFDEIATIPEPTTLSLVAIGAGALLRRRRRR